MAGGDHALDQRLVRRGEREVERGQVIVPLRFGAGAADDPVTKRLFSTQAIAKRLAVEPAASACRAIVLARRSDSGRHSVCIIRLSCRPARVSAGAGASGSYLAVRMPRASGL